MTSKNSVDTIIYEILKEIPEIVLEKYGSTPEDAKKWGFVKNTWEDKQFQEAEWKAFVEKAMNGDPWEGFDGKDAF